MGRTLGKQCFIIAQMYGHAARHHSLALVAVQAREHVRLAIDAKLEDAGRRTRHWPIGR
jgi:hypothetical protein